MMNRKERVLSAINRSEPDRVPVDYAANRFVQAALYEYFQVTDHRSLLERLHVDIVDLRGVVDPRYIGPIPYERRLPGEISENFWGMQRQVVMTATGPEESYCRFVLQPATSLSDLEKHSWPSVDWFDFTDIRKRIREWNDFAVMASGASVFQHPTFLRGLESLLMDLVLAPELAHYLLDKFTDFYVSYFDRLFSTAPGLVDILRIADDFGMQDRLLISLDSFSEFFAPRIKRLVDMAKSHNVYVMFHSCGSVAPLINSLIDLGINILDPIQPHAKDMDPYFIKEQFGSHLCLHGAIDTQHLLTKGSEQDVEEAVRKAIVELGRGGGYILAPSHVLQTDVPLGNIAALYDTAFRFQN
jgi:uroporphyrinogen decarboxylase